MCIYHLGSQSPIHGHANCFAIVKVLHGTINMAFFNKTDIHKIAGEDPSPYLELTCQAEDCTWMSPDYYQTHQLTNTSQGMFWSKAKADLTVLC